MRVSFIFGRGPGLPGPRTVPDHWREAVHALMREGLGVEDIAVRLRAEGRSPCDADAVRDEARALDGRGLLLGLYRPDLVEPEAVLPPGAARVREVVAPDLAWALARKDELARAGDRTAHRMCPGCGGLARVGLTRAGTVTAHCPTPNCLDVTE